MQENAQVDANTPIAELHVPCASIDRALACTLPPPRSATRIVQLKGANRGGSVTGGSSAASRPGSSGPVTGLQILGSDAAGAVVLSAVAGYVDTAGFMALFGLFTAHITGDLVTAGTALTEKVRLGSGARLVMVPIFMLSVAATTLFARRLNRSGKRTLAPMFVLLTLALAMFTITGVTLRPLASAPDAWAVIVIGGSGVVAMGIQNTLMRNVLSSYSPTTIMTGNLTQCTIDLIEMALPDPANDTLARRIARGEAGVRLKKFGLPLLGFMVGAFGGAYVTHFIDLASIAVPTVAMGLLAVHLGVSGEQRAAKQKPSQPSTLRPMHPCTRRVQYCDTTKRRQAWLQSGVADDATNSVRQIHAHSGTYPQMTKVEQLWDCFAQDDELRWLDSVRSGLRSNR